MLHEVLFRKKLETWPVGCSAGGIFLLLQYLIYTFGNFLFLSDKNTSRFCYHRNLETHITDFTLKNFERLRLHYFVIWLKKTGKLQSRMKKESI